MEATERTASRPIEILLLVATVIGVLVSVYFAVRSEQVKQLSLIYTGSRSLLNIDSRNQSNLKVSYDNKEVKTPWLFSARWENTGTIPVENSDIEKPLTITFLNAAILGAEITLRKPSDVAASASFSGSTVVIQHGLLNPGDVIRFDCLLDGEPNQESASFRIKGISKINEISEIQERAAVPVTYFNLSRPFQYSILGFSSAVCAVLVFGLVGIGGGTLLKLWKVQFNWTNVVSDIVSVLRRCIADDLEFALDGELRSAIAALGRPKARWIDSPEDLESQLSMHTPRPTAETNQEVARKIISLMRAQLPELLAHQAYLALPVGIDRAVSRKVQATPMRHGTTAAYVQSIADDMASMPRGERLKLVNKEDLLYPAILILVFLPVCLIVGGAWARMLASA